MKHVLCLPERHFAIDFPMIFNFVPKSTTTSAPTVSSSEPLPDKPTPCERGRKQTTAFICDPCPPGYNCYDPNAPYICPGSGSTDPIKSK